MVNILCGMQHSLTPFGKMKLVFPRDYYMQISFPLGVEVCVQVSFHFYCRMLPWLLSSYDQCFPWFRGLSFLVSCILSGTCTLSASFCRVPWGIWEEYHRDFSFMMKCSNISDSLWDSSSFPFCCKKKLLWSWLRKVLTYEYRRKLLGGIDCYIYLVEQ